MIPGAAPIAAIPIAGVFGGAAAIGSQAEPGVWLAQIAAAASTVRASDRGWIGEPADTLNANVNFPPRMVVPPALEKVLPLYPDNQRRLAISAGELTLMNGDGELDALAGDWTVSGREVVITRGPHRRPYHADTSEFATIARVVAASAAVGTSRLVLPLKPSARNLDIAICDTYLGTGLAEGPAELLGIAKPQLYGIRRNIEPVLINAGSLIYQFHDGAASTVLLVRDRGVALAFGADRANYAAMAATAPATGYYDTCLAEGLIRVGATPSVLTMYARGSTAEGGYVGSAAHIAQQILAGPGGIATANSALFDWHTGEFGMLITGGTVAQAMESLAAGVFGWWGTDSDGGYYGGHIHPPEELTASYSIASWMLAAPPREVSALRAPWWRVHVGYQGLDKVQTGEALAGAVSAADRDYFGRQSRLVNASDAGVQAAYPVAEDAPDLISGFENSSDAQILADLMLEIFSVPRRLFEVRIRAGAGGINWPAISLGTCVTLTWPNHVALASGRDLIVQGVSARGDDVTLSLWG